MKYFYYIGIQINDGMAFITSLIPNNKQFAYDLKKQPLEFSSQEDAMDIVERLCMYFVPAVLVQSPVEIEKHAVSLSAIRELLLNEKAFVSRLKVLGLSKTSFYIEYESNNRIHAYVPLNEEDMLIGTYSFEKGNFI